MISGSRGQVGSNTPGRLTLGARVRERLTRRGSGATFTFKMTRVLLLVLLLAGCTSPKPEAAFLTEHRDAYEAAKEKARLWFDGLKVDPAELRANNIKGKKKLVELLDAYRRLWVVAKPAEKAALLERFSQVAAVTAEDGYHDMGTISDEWFKQDATSYLRAAVLMERMGLDTKRYREEIKKIHPRLNAQMERRGPHQQRVFHWYYATFGLEEPFPLADALQKGVVAQRVEPAVMTSAQMYELTHEVYAVYEYGDVLDIDPFDEPDKTYLHATLPVLVDRLIAAHDPDLMGEVVECLHYLRFEKLPAYQAGVTFLLTTQNANGSWGHYPKERKKLGDFVRQAFELHTTMVVVGALTAVFDRPMPRPR